MDAGLPEWPAENSIMEMNEIKACIFDLDGVIVDTAHYHFMAWRRLARELGFDLTEAQNERLKGVSRMRSLEIVLEIGERSLTEDEKQKLADKKNEWFVGYVDQMTPQEIFPGVKDLIADLRSRHLKVALASSSKNAAKVIALLEIEHLFDTLVDGTMITHSKPDPEIFLKAATNLRMDPAHCLVFEDAEAGVQAAHRAGMRCVGVGSAEILHFADMVVPRTGEFEIADLQQLEIA